MVLQEGLSGLRRRPAMPHHVLGHGRLVDLNAEFE